MSLRVIRVHEDGFLIGYAVTNADDAKAEADRIREARDAAHSRAEVTVHAADSVDDIIATLTEAE